MSDPLHTRRHLITVIYPIITAWMRKVTGCKVISPAPPNRNNPYLFISNHVSIYDLAYILPQLQEMPVIVVHEIFQRNPIAAWLIRPFGLIWKQADLHDGKAIRQMKRAAQAGRSLLLYPEGDLTWDGDTGELPASMIKLVKFIGLPVVAFTEKGAYMTYSRWAGKVRKGVVELNFQPCITAEDLKTVEDGLLMERLRSAFRHSERGWLASKQPTPSYAAGHQARDLSKMLFMCPECNTAGQIVNSDTTVLCLKCGFSAEVDPSLGLDAAAVNKAKIKDIWQWHSWQIEELEKQIDKALRSGTLHLTAELKKAEFVAAVGAVDRIVTKAGFHSRFLKRPEKADAFRAALETRSLTVSDIEGKELYKIPFDKMLAVRVLPMRNYNPNWLLISTEEGYYKLMFKGPAHPPYLWCTALKQIINQPGSGSITRNE